MFIGRICMHVIFQGPYKPLMRSRESWNTHKNYGKDIYIASSIQKKRKERELTCFNSALDLTERMSGTLASIMLKSISVSPFHKSHVGEWSGGFPFQVGVQCQYEIEEWLEKIFSKGCSRWFTLGKNRRQRIHPERIKWINRERWGNQPWRRFRKARNKR